MMKKMFLSISVATLYCATLCFYSCSNDSVGEVISRDKLSAERVDDTRLINYVLPRQSANSSLQGNGGFEIPQSPQIPTGAVDMVQTKYQDWKALENTNYLIAAGTEWNSHIQLKKNTVYYVAGRMRLQSYGSGGKIVVLPGGEIELPATLNNDYVECWGKVIAPQKLTINSAGGFVGYMDNAELNSVASQGVFEVYGKTILKDLTISKTNERLNIGGELIVEGHVKLTNNADVNFMGPVSAATLEVSGNTTIAMKSCFKIAEHAFFTNNASTHLSGYFNSRSVELNSSAMIWLQKDAIMDVHDVMEIMNENSKLYNTDETGYAVVKCGDMVIHSRSIDRLGGGPVDLHAAQITNKTGKELQWTANVVFDGSTFIPAKDCRPEFGSENKPSEPEYVLSHVSEVVSPDGKRISATGINLDGSNAYVSWHQSGDLYEGYIDIINTADIHDMKITHTMHSLYHDFNHITVTDNRIYTVGGTPNGAFWGEVIYAGADNIELNLRQIAGASGNYIVKDNRDDLWSVSGASGGVTIFPSKVFIPLAEAKSATNMGNSIAVLAGIADSKVYEFDLDGALIRSYSVGSIAPENGKNAIATDGTSVYVPLGYNGVKAFANGVEMASFRVDDESMNSSANCVDVDDEFVYLANGNAGLYILKKEDLSLVKHYELGDASANFVKKGADGLIYVAYGVKGVHVFKLIRI